MTRVAHKMKMPARWVLCMLVVALCEMAASAAAPTFQISLPSGKFVMSTEQQTLLLRVKPKQSQLKQLVVETIVDTSGATVASDLTLPGDGTAFSVELKGKEMLPAGLYKMKVSAPATDGAEAVYEVLPFKITVPVEIAAAKVNGAKLAFGDKMKPQLLSSGSGDSLKVQLKVQSKIDKTPLVAHQVFLRFTHTKEHVDTYFVLTANDAKEYSIELNVALLNKKFAYKSGEHAVQLIVGDPSFEHGLTWNLGTVDLLLGAAPPQPPSPLYSKPLLHESDTTLKALPEIKHIMHKQDKRPPFVVSLAFSGAVLAPLGGFLIYVLRLRLNLSKLFSGSMVVYGGAFLAALATVLTLFALYWVKLTMYQTLGYLGVLGTFTLWVGHLALKRLASKDISSKPKVE